MAFIGNRPDRATARATAVFFARAAASAFFRISTLRVLRPKSRSSVRIRSSSWRTTHGGADDLVVDPDRLAAACGHPLPPLKQQARRDAVRAGHERDRHARLQRLLDQPDRLRHPPPPAKSRLIRSRTCSPIRELSAPPVDSESEEKVREKLIVFGSLTRPLTGGRGYSLVLVRAGYDYAAE
jgi:hypothetical protein